MVGFHQGFQIVGRDKDQRVGFTVYGGHAHVHVVIGGIGYAFYGCGEENVILHGDLLSKSSEHILDRLNLRARKLMLADDLGHPLVAHKHSGEIPHAAEVVTAPRVHIQGGGDGV